jgi:hypothetical protein
MEYIEKVKGLLQTYKSDVSIKVAESAEKVRENIRKVQNDTRE